MSEAKKLTRECLGCGEEKVLADGFGKSGNYYKRRCFDCSVKQKEEKQKEMESLIEKREEIEPVLFADLPLKTKKAIVHNVLKCKENLSSVRRSLQISLKDLKANLKDDSVVKVLDQEEEQEDEQEEEQEE